MNSDKAWMYNHKILGHVVPGFKEKVKEFVAFAMSHPECISENKIKCPCNRKKCRNKAWLEPDEVAYHIVSKGFTPDYYRWILHGESGYGTGMSNTIAVSSNERESSSYDYENTYDYDQNESGARDDENMYGYASFPTSGFASSSTMYNQVQHQDTSSTSHRYRDMITDAAGPSFQYPPHEPESPNPNAQKLYRAMRDQETPLYPGCSHSKLSIVTRLCAIKAEFGFSERCYDEIVKLMHEAFPEDNLMPQSFYETKKLVDSLGLPVEKIDCCSLGCMLYWGEDIERTTCKVCNRARGGKNSVLWYFPITPRLQRLYASKATATYMRWHAEHESDPEVMTHPSDSEAWKHFSRTHRGFAEEIRNVRLGLCTDGFMPFGQYAKPYSCWPVILNPYNLPPGMYTKEQFMFLTVLIPGPRNPKQKLDVFLQPLIAELNNLWYSGTLTYDCSLKQNFTMRAALMWTISDFPAYAMLSGWSTQGELACPICMEDTDSWYLPKGRKHTWFDNHRKFLPPNHYFRKDTNSFIKGKFETKMARAPKSGTEIINSIDQMGLFQITEPNHEAHNTSVKKCNKGCGWKKRSILWNLPYWESNLIRHNLDVMHIEKNCFENVFNTVMDIKGKTKDNDKSREDLKTFCTRPKQDKDRNGVYPPPPYRLEKKHSELLVKWLTGLKFPDGYVSNMARCVDGNKLRTGGMKSHDCHVFMQRLVPIAFRGLLEPSVWEALTEFSLFFRELTCTTIRIEGMKRLERDIPVILCKLEKIFPPNFFDPMEHLTVHLAYEARIAGPVQGRWMYPYERLLKRKKGNIGNRSQVQGSIGNAYLTDEIAYFGSLYFEPEVYTRTRRVARNDDGGEKEVIPGNLSIFTYPGRTSGKSTTRKLDQKEYHVASTYILPNCPEVQPYVNIYTQWLREEKGVDNDQRINECLDKYFREWFKSYVDEDTARIGNDEFLLSLSQGPLSQKVKSYPIYFVNGYKFQTMKHGAKRATVNSGVCLKSDYDDFYGNLIEILELEYLRLPIKKTVLFRCEWFDNGNQGTRYHNRYNLVNVNINSRYPKYDPFILASQAMQVCYIPYPSVKLKNWWAVCKVKARATVQLPEIQTENHPTIAFQDDETIGHSIPNLDNVHTGPLDSANYDPDFVIDLDQGQQLSLINSDVSDSEEANELDDNESDDDIDHDDVDEEEDQD